MKRHHGLSEINYKSCLRNIEARIRIWRLQISGLPEGTEMPDPSDNFKVNLNQNLWGLVVGLGALGAAEHYHLCKLGWFGLFISGLMSLSLFATTTAYTINYCRERLSR